MIGYLIALILILALYAAGVVFLFRSKKEIPYLEIILPLLILLCYAANLIYFYIDVGPKDWNFLNALPMQNMSPFCYCLCVLTLFLPRKMKAPFYALFALLSVAMLVAGALSIASYLPRDYAFHPILIVADFPHFLLSFFGLYLVRRRKVTLAGKTLLWGILIPFLIATVMLVLNAILRTAFFGLSLYGDHNIYGVVISKRAAPSILAYYAGLGVVIAIGYALQRFLVRPKR